jgi:Cys-tRNA(Pro)/Cys-tRNA(Cys) deacylase
MGIGYGIHRYEHDPTAESYGMEAANALGVDPSVVFKTLMARLNDDRGPLVVAIVPVDAMLDLKALARAAGAKRAAMARVGDAERATGFVAGGISPFGQKRAHKTFVDETAEVCHLIYVSGGQRGFDLSVAPPDLIAALNATVAPL